MSEEFVGVGWKFPPQLDDQGLVALSRYESDIQEAIWIILSTAPGERLMHPDFGCGLQDYVFAPNDTRTAGLIRFNVEEALNRWEPRIQLQQVRVEADPTQTGVLLINIAYQVRATDSRFNLVYPFYLERGQST